MKQKKSLLILLGILAVLLLLYVCLWGFNKNAEKKKEEETKQARIYITTEEQLSEFSYSGTAENEGTMSFAKGETWTYTTDPEIPLMQSSIQSIADRIAQLPATRKLKSPDHKADYGLEDPSSTISFKNGAGEIRKLLIGGTAGEDYYACIEGEDAVYTIDESLVSSLVYDIDSLVKKDTLPAISSGNLKKVTVTQTGESTAYDSQEDMGELAGGFGTLTLDSCANYHASEEELTSYGLDDANRITVEAVYKDAADEKEKTCTVYIGTTDASGENRYVQLEGSKIIYSASKAIVENMYITGEGS